MNTSIRLSNNVLTINVNKFIHLSINIDETESFISSLNNIAKLFGKEIPEQKLPFIKKLTELMAKIYSNSEGYFEISYDNETKDIDIKTNSEMKINFHDISILVKSLNSFNA